LGGGSLKCDKTFKRIILFMGCDKQTTAKEIKIYVARWAGELDSANLIRSSGNFPVNNQANSWQSSIGHHGMVKSKQLNQTP